MLGPFAAPGQLGGVAVMTEAVVRHSLRQEVLAGTAPTVAAVYEFWVPKSNARADVAVIGDAGMDGFEIKTARDTLKRLPRQAEAYTRLFDRCHVVLADRHVEKAIDILPHWWGVLVIGTNDEPPFIRVRSAQPNSAVDPETLVRLLWREEVYAALCELGTAPDPRAGRFRMWEQLLLMLDLDGLKAVVRDALLCRDPGRARIPSQRFAIS